MQCVKFLPIVLIKEARERERDKYIDRERRSERESKRDVEKYIKVAIICLN